MPTVEIRWEKNKEKMKKEKARKCGRDELEGKGSLEIPGQ